MTESAVFSLSVSLGTDHHRFSRLVEWVFAWAVDQREADRPIRLKVQAGYTPVVPPTGLDLEVRDFVARDVLMEWFRGSDAVVAQGGPGGLMDVRAVGLVPILVPRRAALKEHVDDHQVAFCRAMSARDVARCAETEEALHTLLTGASRGQLDLRRPAVGEPPAAGGVVAQRADGIQRLSATEVRKRAMYTMRNLKDHRVRV